MAAESTTGQAAAAPHGRVDWESWHAHNSLKDLASLQRGARNFMNYCNGCHALKYERYQRMADDLQIPAAALEKDLVPPGSHPLDYITTAMPAADAFNWFGKVPPDLSLITRSKGTDYVYRFLKTFYVDPSSCHGQQQPGLSQYGDAGCAVRARAGSMKRCSGRSRTPRSSITSSTVVRGSMTDAQFDDFVRDTVNFLDYVGEPAQLERQFMGIWVVLFLVLLTWLAWLLKKEYWKDVH